VNTLSLPFALLFASYFFSNWRKAKQLAVKAKARGVGVFFAWT
jgi:hypothetical protein